MRIYPSEFPLNSPGQVDMHMLVKLIFITAAYQHNIARASGDCGKPELADNTVPVSNLSYNIGASIRIQCADGYVRKAGTSSLIRCTQQQNGNAFWHSELPLKCIPDPKKPLKPKPSLRHPDSTPSARSYPSTGRSTQEERSKAGLNTEIGPLSPDRGSTPGSGVLPSSEPSPWTARQIRITFTQLIKSDPKTPHVATTETQRPHQQFTLCTTERTARKNPTLQGTSSPTTTTGHIALTTTNEVVTTKTRRTTSQPITTKEPESITTTNEITLSTSSSFTSREYMTTTSSNTLSGSFTTTTGVDVSVRTSNTSEGKSTLEAFSNANTLGGVTGIILLCLVAALFLFLWLRHRNHRYQIVYHPKPDPCTSYIPIPVCASEHSSAQSNKAAENTTEGSVIDKNPGIPHGADTCDELLPQTDL